MTSRFHSFSDRATLASTLAETVAAALRSGIQARGTATLAVSGGSTPKGFFEALSDLELAWDKVTITLVDERFVPADNARSNHLLVATHLLKNKAASANFLPLYRDTATAGEAAEAVTAGLDALALPFDVVILGMGTDGHTASFFPGGDHLAQSLDLTLPRRVLTMEADGAGEPRLTFSFSALHDARLLALHIEGAEKKTVLDAALAGTDESELPVRAPLNRAATPVDIYWAP
ncbi:6-phosphogluconolactonase [Ciceribacter sp. L1K22]|uniref:6-phosphogluconolactonase n=1 Tax=Ciceribacter sp. L1K22 TaxID=2820275 RepID=UPI001ABDDCFC|nr:6-phosphogluconolactonase [Ciceribacter sp. L1K22]MBO3758904.1 6-phosphogluconolactonase [Ciceribacter sp. L1K22]